ncbi:MAG TPA: VWA domain-containing protein, partial [Terriglobales bacterium]|nr:VWA domain-containing protein [Terriglobales bacterium]
AAQVAVYPVDVRGLTPVEAKPFEEELSRKWAERPDEQFPEKFQQAYHALFDSQDTMKEIADLTGGVAYINRNDLDVAIASAVDDNRESYTIGYYPARRDFNNRFRRIKVKLNGKDATLRYRRGYYANGYSVDKRPSTELLAALEGDSTVSAQIPLVSRLQPSPPAANTPFKIELFVEGGNVTYNGDSDKGAAFLDFAAIALSPNGRTVARTWHRGELRLDSAKKAKAEKTGLIYALPINLPAGQYKIRAGVRDSFTGRIGTIEIPVVVK